MHPSEAHAILGEILERTRRGAIPWQKKRDTKTAEATRCVDYAAPATHGAHGVEIGAEKLEEHATVYEFRVVDDAGEPVYEYALSRQTAEEGEGRRFYEEFVELFTLARHIASGSSPSAGGAKAR